MKVKEFTRKDESIGTSYHLEANDEVQVVDFDKVGVSERDAMVKDPKNPNVKRRTPIKSYYLKVRDLKTGKDVTLTLTATQGKQAQKLEPLKDKILLGVGYTNGYGNQVAIRLKK